MYVIGNVPGDAEPPSQQEHPVRSCQYRQGQESHCRWYCIHTDKGKGKGKGDVKEG